MACLILFVLVTLPVIVHGAPLLDDFGRCVDPQKARYWQGHWESQGIFRPATTLEIVVTNGLCRRVPFSFIILIPWLLTFGVAFLTRGFLGEIGIPSPWREVGAGLWLLAPLGTETALWPATIHVTLGLGLALTALWSFHRGHVFLGALLAFGSYLSAEQVILAMPLAVYMVSPRDSRIQAVTSTAILSLVVSIAYSLWGGSTFGLAVSITQRMANVFRDTKEYVIMPAIGLGAQSIPAAMKWAFPISILVLAAGVIMGWMIGPRLLGPCAPAVRKLDLTHITGGLVLLVLINLPMALDYPHQHSPRIFQPSWLAIVIFAVIVGPQVRWHHKRLVGATAGVLIGGAVLSLALSSWVRVETSRLVEQAMERIAAQTPPGGVVAICGLTRTLVQPAPYGAFSSHEFIGLPAAAYEYYTGKTADIRVGGYAAEAYCPDTAGADVVLDFQNLVASRAP